MEIEKYWDNAVEFCIRFISKDNRIINKKLTFNSGITEDEVLKIVYTRFNKVEKVIYIEELYDALVYKGSYSSHGKLKCI